MPIKPPEKSNRLIVLATTILLVAAIAIGVSLFMKRASDTGPDTTAPGEKRIAVPTAPVIDYNQLEKDEELKQMMQSRKEQYGMEKGVNIIAEPHESLKIGDSTIPMKEILDDIRLDRGKIIEGDLKQPGDAPGQQAEIHEAYGIYVVQPGDNIWNIHFQFLKSYFDSRGIMLSPLSDEPDPKGFSSGVGKILKFSEKMVYIYNIKEHKLDTDINLIYPLSKIVVFNMREVYTLLDQIDYPNVNRLQFDGETIWIPAQQ